MEAQAAGHRGRRAVPRVARAGMLDDARSGAKPQMISARRERKIVLPFHDGEIDSRVRLTGRALGTEAAGQCARSGGAERVDPEAAVHRDVRLGTPQASTQIARLRRHVGRHDARRREAPEWPVVADQRPDIDGDLRRRRRGDDRERYENQKWISHHRFLPDKTSRAVDPRTGTTAVCAFAVTTAPPDRDRTSAGAPLPSAPESARRSTGQAASAPPAAPT